MRNQIKIKLLDSDGIVRKRYSSKAEAARDFGTSQTSIGRAVKSGRLWNGFYVVEDKQEDKQEDCNNENVNESTIKEFDEYIKKLGINKDEIKSVKFWQTQSGSLRYSIVKNFEEDYDNKEEFYTRLKEDLAKEIVPLKLPVEETFKISKKEARALIIYTSDKHIGADNSGDLYDNDYNKEECKNRIFKILNKILKLYFIYGRFDKIIITDLGDSLDGYHGKTTRGKHPVPQNMHPMDAFDAYIQIHKEFFDTLVRLNICDSIDFYTVTNDNHSGTFGYCANRALEIYLNVKYSEIKTVIMKKFIEHFHYGIHTFMLCHGKDNKDMKYPLPLKIDVSAEQFIHDYIDYNKLNERELHFIKGNLHQSISEQLKRFRSRGIPAIIGSSKWSQHNYGGPLKPGASFDIVGKNCKDVTEGNIWL